MKTRLILTLALLLICTGAALAQTPDLLPPARETVCDNEAGAAYGLCNAYCEAMDCESGAPQASATACEKVRTKFQNVAGRDVPCELTCPCQGIPEFNALLATVNYCYEASEGTVLSEEPELDVYIAAGHEGEPPPLCGYINESEGDFIFLPITPEQEAFCREVLRDAAASRGVTCGPPPGPEA
ncbi:MAG TPA: hypothetical protein VF789_16725 [Thermoanaerobaculia bacterium]